MSERQVPSVPNDRSDLSEESQEDLNKRLAEGAMETSIGRRRTRSFCERVGSSD